MKEAPSLPAQPGARGDTRLLGEYRANAAVAVNEVDQAPFRAATASVMDALGAAAHRRLRQAPPRGGLGVTTWSTPFHTVPAPARALPHAAGPAAPAGTAAGPCWRADGVDRVVAMLCQGVLLLTGVVLMGVLTANVIARYVLASGGFDWAEEVPEQLFPWFIMAGVVLAVQHGGHIAVEALLGLLGREGKRWVLLAGHALVDPGLCRALAGRRWWWPISCPSSSAPPCGLPGTYGYWAIAAGCVLLALGTVTVAIRVALLGPEAMPQPSPEEMPT